MAVEDFTTYTLASAGGTIGVTSTRATATSFMSRNATGYVQGDKGANHFNGNFSHLLTVDLTSPASGAVWAQWILSNLTGDLFTQISGGDSLSIYFFDSGPTLTLRSNQSGVDLIDTFALSNSTIYYLTIARAGTIFRCDVYSDSGRTTLVHTLTVTSATAISYRYITVASGYNDGGNANTMNGYVENLDLQEGGGGPTLHAMQLL